MFQPCGNIECIVLSVAISWRYRAGVFVLYLLILQLNTFCLCHLLKQLSLDIDQFYFKSLFNPVFFALESTFGKATRCPMNFIWNENTHMRYKFFHIMRYDIVFLLHILTQDFYVSLLKCCFGRMRSFLARNFSLARIYIQYFQNFFQHRDYRKFYPRCNFDS